jgi:hypothetical protein
MSLSKSGAHRALLFALAILGCDRGTPVEPDMPPAVNLDVTQSSTLLSINFESYPLGPLGSPWGGYRAGSSTISVVNTTYHGHVLRQVGGTATGDYLSYSTPFPSVTRTIAVEFDVMPASGASPTFILRGSGYGASNNQLRLQRTPGSNALIAGTLTGPNCGNLTNGSWNHVILTVSPSTSKYTVKINGVSTPACTNATTTLDPPYKGIGVFDPSNAGYGGVTSWDNFSVH